MHCKNVAMIVVVALSAWLLAPVETEANKAKIPDLTNGGKPTSTLNGNLGPTGMEGWVFHQRSSTKESRQILVTKVDKGSPADGVLKQGDVILGASGTNVAPEKFNADALRSFAIAIADAEARAPATLRMLRWRQDKIETVAITLETMGAYSPTAPYNCPKSMNIINKALQYIDKHEAKPSRTAFNTLALLACNDDRFEGNAARQKRARKQIIGLLPQERDMQLLTSDRVETGSKIAWTRSYAFLVLTEYYLATGDNPSNGKYDLLTAIDAYAQTITRGQSMFGTMGHQYAMQGEDGSIHGPYRVGYGPINATGLASLMALTMARECKLPNPKTRAEIEAGIQRAARFFASYAGKGSIPYGEHGAWTKGHASNGKNGLAALALARVPGREAETRYFAQMAIAAAGERVSSGHGGTFFNYTWSPLGANVGGIESAAAHFREISWHLDLSRTWRGAFFYNDYANPGYHGPRFRKGSMYMSTPALLAYAMPLKKLVITGRELTPKSRLTPAEIAQGVSTIRYSAGNRPSADLVKNLGHFSVTVANRAQAELITREDVNKFLPQMHAYAKDPTCSFRDRVVSALGDIAHQDSVPILGSLLKTNANPDKVRAAAAVGLSRYPNEIRMRYLDDMLRFTASLKQPLGIIIDDDPMQAALSTMAEVLFSGKKSMLGGSLAPLNKHSSRERFHDAVRAVANHPSGGLRGRLNSAFKQMTYDDVKALGDTLVELIRIESPADAMFADGSRIGAVELLTRHRVAEGVPLSMELWRVGGSWTRTMMFRQWMKYKGSVRTITPDPNFEGFLLDKHPSPTKESRDVFNAIASDKNPKPLRTLKEIRAVKAAESSLKAPARQTVLSVDAVDYAKGDLVFTWRKVHGAGAVSFAPNGTGDAGKTRVTFDGTPGKYLFEVTVSDARGFTEVSGTVPVTLLDARGALPVNRPPVAKAQSILVVSGKPTRITLTAVDPERRDMAFTVTSKPANGALSGNGANLVYTSNPGFTGVDQLTFKAMDSEGAVHSAKMILRVAPGAYPTVIYEPFNMVLDGELAGMPGGSGLGKWQAIKRRKSDIMIGGKTLQFQKVPAAGKHAAINHRDRRDPVIYGIDVAKRLRAAKLLEHGGELWLSAVMRAGRKGGEVFVALAADQAAALADSKKNAERKQHFAFGASLSGQFLSYRGQGFHVLGVDPRARNANLACKLPAEKPVMVVVQVVWGEDATAKDTVRVYVPQKHPIDDRMYLGQAHKTATGIVDQSKLNRLMIGGRNTGNIIDEIRVGTTYQSVLTGNAGPDAR